MDEAALIVSAQQGDLDSFNRLVLAYQDMVFTQAVRLLNDDQAANDATQEAFISAFRGIRKYRGGSFRAWLLRIVTNACYDELRRQKRRPTTPLEPLDDAGDEIESPAWIADPQETPEEAVERSELGSALKNCIEKLPVDFKTVLFLVDVQGLDYNEVSVVIDKPLGTVKSRLARGRLRLRDCLQGYRELLPVKFRLKSEV
jgi:RNA polymerase sigma-70 factor, ECF subfamily